MSSTKASASQFKLLYFAAATSFTGKQHEYFAAPLPLSQLFPLLEQKYPGITDKVLFSSTVTLNLDYIDFEELTEGGRDAASSRSIAPGDEVAIIPPSTTNASLGHTLTGVHFSCCPDIGMENRRGNDVGVLDPRLQSTPSLPPLRHAISSAHPMNGSSPHNQNNSYYQSQSAQIPYAAQLPALHFNSVTESNPISQVDSSSQHETPRSAPSEQHASPAEQDDQAAEDAKRPRACEACRGLKVRCDQDPQHPEIPCKRCAKAGRACIIGQSNRKRQKKADTRVAELEKKLDALTAVLHQQQQSQHPPPSPFNNSQSSSTLPLIDNLKRQVDNENGGYSLPSWRTHNVGTDQSHQRTGSQDCTMLPPFKRRRIDSEVNETETLDGADVSRTDMITEYTSSGGRNSISERSASHGVGGNLRDYLQTGSTSPEEFVRRINNMISADMGATIFNRYTTELMPRMPAVAFPKSITAEQMWKEKPILYVCILSVSSTGMLHPDISRQLAKETIGAIADCVVRNGAKSLELIQALQIMALWYRPPERAGQTNFYQIIHMAAVMALDIGLGKRFNPSKARRGFGGPNAKYAPGPRQRLPQDSDTLEARRAWLCCYYLCASASMVLRRPNLIRWTYYMKECLEVLETHPDALRTDALFCQHVKIQHICEDIGQQFLMDDSTANVSISDPKVSYQLHVLENDLRKWRDNIPEHCRGPVLQFFEHITNLYLHEIALHFNHNVDDFRLPFTEESLKSVSNPSETLTTTQMAALEACRNAAHGVIDTMAKFELTTVETMPMLIFFVRNIYAIVILIKMHVAISVPGSEIGKIMKAEDLRVEHYLETLFRIFGSLTKQCDDADARPRPIRIIETLQNWFEKHKDNVAMQKTGAIPGHHDYASRKQGEYEGATPLDTLSSAASRNSESAPPVQQQNDQNSWTFDSITPFNPSRRPPPGHPDNSFPLYQKNPAYPMNSANDTAQEANMLVGVDPVNPPELGWGTGFEQAMDMAMGSADGLVGDGLDGWFLGDSVAPFGFGGDVPAQW